jgi:phosphoribosylglycinamide formyltransferase-1
VLVSGAGTNCAALTYAARLPDAPYEVVLIATNNPQSPALNFARAEGIATFVLSHKGMVRSEHDAAMMRAINEAGATHVALAGYMRILGDPFVDAFAGRMLNIHPSLLPKYTGLDTHARAIEAGDSHAGTSVHLVTRDLDAGEVLGQIAVPIASGDTPDTLAERVQRAEHQLYPRVLADFVSRPFDPAFLLEKCRTLADELPETEERPSHGSPGWKLAGKSGKYFAHFSDRHHGSDAIGLLVKVADEDEVLAQTEIDPQVYYRPAYYGASGWLGIRLNRADTDWAMVRERMAHSWRSVAPKRLVRLEDVADQF